jgi:branched-subunit amino acid aminotransferase/4-amino-4-deoxychorismate lyase
MTPRLDDGLLAGVTRDWVCRLVKDAGYVLQEKKLGVSDLASADEIFLTSTIMEIMPVSRVVLNYDQHRRQFRLGPYAKTSGTVGPVVLDLMHRFRESIGRFSRL